MTYGPLSATIGAEVRAELARQQRSAIWLAEAANIPHPTLRRRLAADGNLTVDELDSIARALGVSMLDLFPKVEAA